MKLTLLIILFHFNLIKMLINEILLVMLQAILQKKFITIYKIVSVCSSCVFKVQVYIKITLVFIWLLRFYFRKFHMFPLASQHTVLFNTIYKLYNPFTYEVERKRLLFFRFTLTRFLGNVFSFYLWTSCKRRVVDGLLGWG